MKKDIIYKMTLEEISEDFDLAGVATVVAIVVFGIGLPVGLGAFAIHAIVPGLSARLACLIAVGIWIVILAIIGIIAWILAEIS